VGRSQNCLEAPVPQRRVQCLRSARSSHRSLWCPERVLLPQNRSAGVTRRGLDAAQ
jgi:hypothetical protein